MSRPDKRREKEIPPSMAEDIFELSAAMKMEEGKSKNTLLSYKSDIELFAEFAALKGCKTFAAVTPEMLASWIASISPYTKAATQSRKLSAMRELALYLVDKGDWNKNYCDLIARPRVRRSVPEELSAVKIDDIISKIPTDTPEGIRDRAMVELMYGSGLRVSELCSLKFSEMDLEEKIVRITGKGDKTRLVPMGDIASDAIELWKAARPQMARKPDVAEFFITRRGRKLSRKSFWYNLKKYGVEAGLGRTVKPHSLRHSFATHLLRNGANLMSIKEMLGHASLSTTQIYTQLLNEDILREYQKHPRKDMTVDDEL